MEWIVIKMNSCSWDRKHDIDTEVTTSKVVVVKTSNKENNKEIWFPGSNLTTQNSGYLVHSSYHPSQGQADLSTTTGSAVILLAVSTKTDAVRKSGFLFSFELLKAISTCSTCLG